MNYQQNKSETRPVLPSLSILTEKPAYTPCPSSQCWFVKRSCMKYCAIFFILFSNASLVRSQFGESDSTSVAQGSIAPSAIDPNQLVLQTIQQLVWGPSYSCNVRQISFFNDLQLVAEGEYYQAGEGSGQVKVVIAMTAGEMHSQFTQISDGRLLWTAVGEKEPPRRVYLDRVRQSLGSMARNPVGHPEAAIYLAIGGHAEMMRSLYGRYRWYKVFTGVDSKGTSVWQLIGTLRKEPPPLSTRTRVDSLLCSDTPAPEVPTDVRLTLGRDGKLNLFPLKIEYYRQSKASSNQPGKYIPLSTIQVENVVSPIQITKEMFQYKVRDDADQIDDETNDYLPITPLAETVSNPRR